MGYPKGQAAHRSKTERVSKICMNPKCRRKFKDFSALNVEPTDPTKPEPGICPKCKRLAEDFHYLEEDYHGQNIGEQ